MEGKLTLRTGQVSSSTSPTNEPSFPSLVSTVDEIASLTDSEFRYTNEEASNNMVTETSRIILLGAYLLTTFGRYLMLSNQCTVVGYLIQISL